jgi:VWFA-related protein
MLVALALAVSPLAIQAQTASAQPSTNAQQPSAAAPDQTDSGGPAIENGPIVLPKKKESEEPPPPPAPEEPKVKNPNGQTYAINVNVPEVHLDVSVILDKNHQFVPGLKASNFLVLEDGVEQKVDTIHIAQTPITAVMLLEFAANNWYAINDMENAAVGFFRSLRPDDYIALMTYDLQTHILADFTSNKQVIAEAMQSLTIPTFSDTNTFDALYETLDRLSRVEGRKYVILIGTGRDTFSKITLDKILAKIKATPNVTIFTVGTGQTARIMADGAGMMGPVRNLDYLQADNQMNTFARMTGGMSFFPRFIGEMPDIFREINESIRNQYVLSYHPTNTKQDGTYRKLRVELVDNEGHPLRMQDEKHKPLKYDVIARDGYHAKQQVE